MKKNYVALSFALCFCLATNLATSQSKLSAKSLNQNSKSTSLRNEVGLKPTGVIKISEEDLKLGSLNNILISKLQLNNEYTFIKSDKIANIDKNGNTHQRYQQYYKGIKVEFGEIITHTNSNNILYAINGEAYNLGDFSSSASLSKNSVLNSSLSKLGIIKPMWEDIKSAKFANYIKPEGEKVIIPNRNNPSQFHTAYKYDIFAASPQNYRAIVYVDANTGEILFENAIIKHATNNGHEAKGVNFKTEDTSCISILAPNEAQTKYSGTRTVNTLQNAGDFTLFSTPGGTTNIVTFDANNAPVNDTSQATLITDPNNDNFWQASEFPGVAQGELDAHWGAEQVYDYWLNVHGRDSYDGAGTQLNSLVHVDNNLVNAFWNGSFMSYGDGNGTSVDILTALDICAHEIGHAVINTTSNLAYQRESGALNEGFADIWGAIVEHRSKGVGTDLNPDNNTTWIIAEDISGGFRSLSNPNLGNQPDTYGGTHWINPNCGTPTQANDYCGVHTNSGVINYWFFLTVEGGSGTNDIGNPFNVTGIGMTKADLIVELLQNSYLGVNSTHADARTLGIQAAEDLFGACSQEVETVTNAFYAVGVGAAYAEPAACQGSAISFASTLVGQTEGSDCAFTDVTVPLTIGTGASQNAVVNFTVEGTSTASNTVDYQLLNNSVNFAAGSTATQNLVVRIFNDNFVEGDETINITFSVNANGGNAVSGTNNLTLTIIDDDFVPTGSVNNTLLNSDLEAGDTTTWIPISNDGNAINFQLFSGVSYLPGVDGQFLGTDARTAVQDDLVHSGQISISANSTVSLNFSVAGFQAARAYEVYWTTSATIVNAADIIGVNGTLLESGTAPADANLTRSIDLSALAGQTGYLAFRSNSPTIGGILLIDTISIVESISTPVQTAVNTGNADNVALPTTGNVYSSDVTTSNLMADITSNTAFDYGCTTVAVSRAGNSAQSYNGSTGINLVTDKTFTITPSNTNATGSTTVSFYFTDAELSGWEAATGGNRSDLGIIKDNGAIEPATSLSVTNFGDNYKITGNFSTGLSGTYYFGNSATLSVEENNVILNSFTVYPNPSSGLVNFRITTSDDIAVNVLDIRGRNVYSNSIANSSKKVITKSINLNNLSKGVYIFNVVTGNTVINKKLIIE